MERLDWVIRWVEDDVVDGLASPLVFILLCLIDLLCGVYVYSPSQYLVPSASKFSRVFGPYSLCLHQGIGMSITWERHDS